jgi:hypothetical protein
MDVNPLEIAGIKKILLRYTIALRNGELLCVVSWLFLEKTQKTRLEN